MSEAPEKIWAWSNDTTDRDNRPITETGWEDTDYCAKWHEDRGNTLTQYIRADLVEAAVKRAIEECTRKAEKLSECCQSCAGVGREVRAIFQDPEAIAKIIRGDA